MKKSISYWSFSGKNVFEAMRLAKDAGFDGIELTLDAEGDVTMETAPEKLAEIRRAAEEIGIALPSVARVCTGRIRLLRTIRRSGKRRIRRQSARSKRQRRWARTQF